jgi:hypothetical protein
MDIHPPEHPIRSLRDFLIQIFTVTVGIIIALGLEALVTWRGDVALARAARADFTAELTSNIDKITNQLPGMRRDAAWMTSTITWGEARLKHLPTKPQPDGPDNRSFVVMANAAWDTALATQAIHHLRFTEARSLAEAYTMQKVMNDMTLRAEDQWLGMAAYSGDPASLNDADLRAGLATLRIAAAYTSSLLALEQKVMAQDNAALKEVAK